ncbi:hypothetical protein Nepgr_024194 [Nepenthes gracilis]|uniref:Uncharacterized protein n=1 Tax=Nepenthes gracilis TaxID=150966 RepID=A0AAD3Y085_NEPGR|nr:hypothetical protein Nepgr_024194 [Nepenthes gracilis]
MKRLNMLRIDIHNVVISIKEELEACQCTLNENLFDPGTNPLESCSKSLQDCNRIRYLTRLDGSIASLDLEIHEDSLGFFRSLLGIVSPIMTTAKGIQHFNSMFVPVKSLASLSAISMTKEVRSIIFCMRDSYVCGSVGFSVVFFKAS